MALDAMTFQTFDTDENMAEWPYAGCQKPECNFPVMSALVAHSLSGGGSEVLVTAPRKAHDFWLYVMLIFIHHRHLKLLGVSFDIPVGLRQ